MVVSVVSPFLEVVCFSKDMSFNFTLPQSGESAVIHAVWRKNADILRELVRAGSNLNLQNKVQLHRK